MKRTRSAAGKAAPRTSKAAKPGKAVAELAVIPFETAEAFRSWLARNHASSPGIWLKLAKKGSGLTSITQFEAVDAALRWGWIDGQGKSLDATHWLTKFTPRGPRSLWSKINRERALALIARGEMQPPGLAEVERAQADGRWDAAYDSPSKASVPDDFARALAKKPQAKAQFAKLDSANRYAILWRLQTAKRPETRARHIERFVAMLARGEKLHA